MNMSELQKLQAARGWKEFVFDSANQQNNGLTAPVALSMAFDSMQTWAVMPGLVACISFTAGHKLVGGYRCPSSLAISNVTSVDLGPESVLGDVLEITCSHGLKYIVIARA